ncbi:hypothetical protein BGW39_011940 [Mortierella sp. 14UC]|nr:hypothetical protein BGW39_011940 [Mortierella sp. 14UC]
MGDHISTPASSKRKDLDSKGEKQSGDAKKQKSKSKSNKKNKDNGDTIDTHDTTELTAKLKTNTPIGFQDASTANSSGTIVASVTTALSSTILSTSGAKPRPMSKSGASQAQVTPLPATPKDVARSVLAFGLLPRQVAKRPASKSRVPASSLAATGTSSTLSTATVKFRARDIMAQAMTTVPSTFRGKIDSTTTSATPIATVSSASTSDPIITSASTIIKAEPLFIKPNNNPHRYEFPYGNYPNYYEKRIQEQTKRHKPTFPASTTSGLAEGVPKTVEVWDKVWENQTEEGYHQRKHFRLSATPTVLFPARCILYSSASGSGSRKRSAKPKESKMTLVDLAKKVDLRLEFLEPTWFRGKRVLDIGCNSALLTVFIALHYKPQKIQGVDIDASLIGKAQKFVLKTFSQLSTDAYTQTKSGPSTASASPTNTQDVLSNKNDDIPYEEYFPKAMQKIHGTLPVPKRTERTEHLFPHNIELRVADWVTEPEDANDTQQEHNQLEQWDVIIGFSLTKWVHLHHGDDGLKRFFHKVYRNLALGGVFLVEPQDFSTYAKRSKITPEMKKTYGGLKFRPEEFRDYLVNEVGFRESQHLGQSDGHAKNFNRDIFLFRK